MGRHKLAILIPTFNEEKSIENIINSVKKHGTPIVINDGSTDLTYKIAVKAGAVLINHKKNLGYDKALNSGFKFASEAGYEYILTMDGDGQHMSDCIPDFIIYLSKGADCVVGVRNKKQRIAEYLFSFYTDLRWRIRDPLCGMKAYNMRIYKDLGYFDKRNLIGTELLMYAIRKKYNINELNIEQKERLDYPRFGSGLSPNLRIIRALFYTCLDDFLNLLKT